MNALSLVWVSGEVEHLGRPGSLWGEKRFGTVLRLFILAGLPRGSSGLPAGVFRCRWLCLSTWRVGRFAHVCFGCSGGSEAEKTAWG